MTESDREAIEWADAQVRVIDEEIASLTQAIADLEEEQERHRQVMESAAGRKRLLQAALRSYEDARYGRDRDRRDDRDLTD